MSSSIPSLLNDFVDTLNRVAQSSGQNTQDLGEFIDLLREATGVDLSPALHPETSETAQQGTDGDGQQPAIPQSADGDAPAGDGLPDYLLEHQARYETNATHFEQARAELEASWAANPEALRRFQQTYSPNAAERGEAVAWLQENLGQSWRVSMPHVMETGNLLGEALPDYLAIHLDRYVPQQAFEQQEAEQLARWTENPEALRMIQQTYSPDFSERSDAVAWLEENMGSNWQISAPHVMETGKLLTTAVPDYLAQKQERYDALLTQARMEQALAG